ncbi:hypothetical protein [Parasphingorhabdus flavimaris]|uniref:hypothetical protein n=1 Tax=Parasphingorhabdus flavimaris TaxID=266812 RepID=UPI003001BD79
MDDTQFQSVLADVAAGSTPTDACQKVLSTSAHLMKFLTEHPDGMVYQAALWQAEGDARIERSDRMLQKLSDRVGDGFVTTPAMARIETDQINKLRTEGFNMRERAARQLSQLHKAEQERVLSLSAPAAEVKQPTSWADAEPVQAMVPVLRRQTMKQVSEPAQYYAGAKATPPRRQAPFPLAAAELEILNDVTQESLDSLTQATSLSMNYAKVEAAGFAVPPIVSKTDAAPVRQNPHARLRL